MLRLCALAERQRDRASRDRNQRFSASVSTLVWATMR
jgi:hypothetical protein